jgi:2-amino-4-hydroxy-6-hydroxymethyldihydropteridine diphosphokinase
LNPEPRRLRQAYVGLGSNVDPARHLARALDELGRQFGRLERSPVCDSPAAGYVGPDYWNLCVAFETDRPAAELKTCLKQIEQRLGRKPDEPRNAPKVLDADLLLLGDEIAAEPPLPHPEILTRAYVLGPLAMLAPDRRLPGSSIPLGELWRDFEGRDTLRVLFPDPFRIPEPR